MPDFLFVLKQGCACIVFLSHLLLLTFVNIFRQKCILWSPLGIWFNCFLTMRVAISCVYVYVWKMFFLFYMYFCGSPKETERIHYKLLNWLLQYWNPPWQPKNSLVLSFKQLCFELFCFVYTLLGFVTLALVSPAALTPH